MELRNACSRGMSIIELMVAMALALVGTVVIFQVYAVNEEVRRSSIAGSDEQTNGLLGLMQIERELRHAGFGINDSDLSGCKMVTYDNQRVPNYPPSYPLAAVQITTNAGNVPDVINVIYAGTTNTAVPVKLGAQMANTLDYPIVRYAYGYVAGDMIIIGEAGSSCTIREITKVNGLELQTVNGTYTQDISMGGASAAARWNDPAGTPALYDENGKVINLGNLVDDTRPPRYNQITVNTGLAQASQNNKLVIQNLWGQLPTFIPIAEQIVQLKAQYGMDDGVNNGTVAASPFLKNDGIVDRYVDGAPNFTPASADWKLVKTVRVAVVARSAAPLKPTTAGSTVCDATPAFNASLAANTYPVRWAFGPDAPLGRPIDVSNSADWRCYKYRVFETIVPLRNVVWSAS